ncbi:MAG: Gfo/Idh/MocA family oxidoreductase, partial [Armatimonadetes bacterium]|nr:Gfo/Idh/MocA family oxidoreductase [Armatimonadota bacterium]
MNLVRTTAAQGSLAMICDENEVLLKKAASLAPDAVETTKMSEVLENPAVEAVMVATPSPYHFPHAKSAILAGKHVYVEKPLTLSVRDAEELVALAERHKRILMVGHLLKYHPAVLHIKKMIDSGELGELYYVYSHRLNLGVIRKEENALWSLAPHDISVLLFFI